ncbi:MAG: SseB family protein [Oscillospiraceae bacterium]|nr:SseB family protein [Oscillospiraceae bacterium]
MAEYIDPASLEDGQVLLYLKHNFLENRSMDTLSPLMSCLRDSKVIVPMNRVLAGENTGLIESLGPGEELTMPGGTRLKPDILRSGEKRFFPIFSATTVIPGDYGKKFTTIKLPMIKVIELAHTYQVEGLALDPFSESMVLPFEIADEIAKLESNLPPDTPME